MNFWDTLDKLRQKPENTRRKLMWFMVGVFSFVLFSAWLFIAKPFSVEKREVAREEVKTNLLSPLATVSQNFGQLKIDLNDALRRFGVLSQEPPKQELKLREEVRPQKLPLIK